MFFTVLLCIFNNLVLQGQQKINMWVPATSAVSRLFHLFPAEHCSVVAAVTVIPHRRHSDAMLHTVLHPVVRPDAAAYQHRR